MKRLLSILFGAMCFGHVSAQEYLKVSDGTYIPLDNVVSIKTTVREHEGALSKQLENNQDASIYIDALKATGFMESFKCYDDPDYGWRSDQDRLDSCKWTNDALCRFVSLEYDNVAFPEVRKYEHTVFLCKDETLASKYGIKSLNDLRKKAKELYNPLYPEDASVNDETDSRNSLNRFMAYHILNFTGDYYKLTAVDSKTGKLQNNFFRGYKDIADWYETMLPHSIMKFSFPSGSDTGLYINRRGVQSRADERGVFVKGAKVVPPTEMEIEQTCVNGVFHYVDDILVYDNTTKNVVCDDIIRMDCSTLSPDFMTRLTDGDMARGHHTMASADNGMYGNGAQGATAKNNTSRCIAFKPGFVRNFSFDENTTIHVRNRVLDFWSYEGDEVIISGKFDVNMKLPSVPAGTYEVRLFTCTGFTSYGTVAFYLDGSLQGWPVSFAPSGRTLFGNDSDRGIGDPEAIAAFDRVAHNKGWVRGPKEYCPGTKTTALKDLNESTSMRDLGNTVRCVIGTFTTDGKDEHYLRIKQLDDSSNNILSFDFIELVPKTVYDSEMYKESIW